MMPKPITSCTVGRPIWAISRSMRIYFTYLYVYYSDMNCLMDAQRLFTEETQIMNALNKNLHIGEEFFTLTAEMNYNRFYMLEDGSLLFLRTLSTRGAGKEPIITLAAAVNTESIREMLAQTGENASGHAWLLSPDGFSINIDNVPCPVGYQEALSAEEKRRAGSAQRGHCKSTVYKDGNALCASHPKRRVYARRHTDQALVLGC